MSKGQKVIRRISGATDIALYSGEHLLIGRPAVFGTEFREMIAAHKPGLTERMILNIRTYASHGVGRLSEVLMAFDGWGGTPLSSRGIVQRVAGLVRHGALLALVMPAVTLNDITTDKTQLEEMSADLAKQEGVNPEMSIEGKSFSDLDGMTDKLVYVIKASGKYFSIKSVATAFAKAMTMTAIISAAVVLAAWAASHFFGVGFAVDVILIAIGWIMIGWAIFSAVRGLWKCVKKIHHAKSIDELEDAAKMFAKIVTDFGVELFIGLLTRGAGKMRAKASAKPSAGGSAGAKPKSKAEIEADNKAKADAKPKPKSRTEIIDARIKTDSKFARDIKKDDKAVYGYTPKEGSSIPKFDIDYHDPKSVAAAHSKRKTYLEGLNKKKAALDKKIADIKKSGGSIDELARDAVNKRNQGRIDSYLKDKNFKGLDKMYKRNIVEYGRKEGPTLESLLSKGKSLEDIIYSSTKTNDGFSAVLGLWP